MYRKILLSLLLVWVSVQSLVDFFPIVFLPNDYRDTPSAKWLAVFVAVSLYTLFFVVANLAYGWRRELRKKNSTLFQKKFNLPALRQRLGWGRYLLALFLIFATIYFFQYSLWGLVFRGVYFRVFVWINLVYILAFLLADGKNWSNWRSLFGAVVATSFAFGLAGVFANIVSYPFGLYWSDGNRIWDYSLIFGRHLYDYPVGQEIPSLTSFGRQVLWGLPFLLPNNTIWLSRLWSAILFSLPSIILGWHLFAAEKGKRRYALLLGLWSFLFLNQGPIYTPLTLCAILVVLAWERPVWLAVPLIALAGYYAEVSRFTWFLAPAVWAGMLSLNRSKLKGVRPALRDWSYGILLGVAGLLPWVIRFILKTTASNTLDTMSALVPTTSGNPNVFANTLELLTTHPLVWTRLFPSPTYPEGVLGALVIAILPLGILLIYLYKRDVWMLLLGQKVAVWLSLLGFGAMGVVASMKVGGGNNLHNMDMFLITLLFIAAIAWRNGGHSFVESWDSPSFLIKTVMLLAFVLPAFPAFRGFRPLLTLNEVEIKHVQILTGQKIVETLPQKNKISDALWAIERGIQEYAPLDEVLFIDQRQLLTFGYVSKVPLVVEYEKKVLMNEALAGNRTYFQLYYKDLSAQRFSLIVSEPMKLPQLGGTGSFSLEGDLWTKWVAAPTLCFYEPLFTLRDVYVQLLVPRDNVQGCEIYLE